MDVFSQSKEGGASHNLDSGGDMLLPNNIPQCSLNSPLDFDQGDNHDIMDRDLETAESFLDQYQNGFIGISSQICDTSPALL